MPRPAYQLGPLDPSNNRDEEDHAAPKFILNMREALTETYFMKAQADRPPPFQTKGPGFIYNFSAQGGPVIYSPNCLRPDLLPPGPHVDYKSDSVLGGRNYDLPYFSQPQFWTRSQGYFAFTPRTPINTLLPTFSCLGRSPTARQSPKNHLFRPHSVRWCDWTDLEKRVVGACNTLGRCVGLPTAYPAWPSARIQAKKYSDEAELELDISQAKDWFSVWLGILAYQAAALSRMGAEIRALGLPRVVPAWMDILLNPPNTGDKPLDEVFVTDVSQSVCRFDGAIARVGTFIVIPEDYDREMVSVDWLLSLNIPIFWEWTQREVKIAQEKPYFKRFEPPPDAVDVFKVRQKPSCSQSHGTDVDPESQNQRPPDTSQVHDMDVDLSHQPQVSPHGPPAPRSILLAPEGPPPSVQEAHTEPDPPLPASPHTLSRSKFRRRPDPTDAQLVEWRRAEIQRKETAARLEVLETGQRRAFRLAREKNPPTRMGKVTMWVWSLGSNAVYSAEKVDDEEMSEMFSSESLFSRDQAIYDSFSEKWHIADFLGRPTDDQLEHIASHSSEYHGTPYLLEITLLRVWYGLDDIPSESPHEMKVRLVAEANKSQTALEGAEHGAEGKVDHRQPNPDVNGDSEPMDMDPPEGAVLDTVDELSGARDGPEASAYLLGGYLVPILDIVPNEPPSKKARTVIRYLLGQSFHNLLNLDSDYWATHKGRSLGLLRFVVDGRRFGV